MRFDANAEERRLREGGLTTRPDAPDQIAVAAGIGRRPPLDGVRCVQGATNPRSVSQRFESSSPSEGESSAQAASA
jgi:hypothetical protein